MYRTYANLSEVARESFEHLERGRSEYLFGCEFGEIEAFFRSCEFYSFTLEFGEYFCVFVYIAIEEVEEIILGGGLLPCYVFASLFSEFYLYSCDVGLYEVVGIESLCLGVSYFFYLVIEAYEYVSVVSFFLGSYEVGFYFSFASVEVSSFLAECFDGVQYLVEWLFEVNSNIESSESFKLKVGVEYLVYSLLAEKSPCFSVYGVVVFGGKVLFGISLVVGEYGGSVFKKGKFIFVFGGSYGIVYGDVIGYGVVDVIVCFSCCKSRSPEAFVFIKELSEAFYGIHSEV